MKSIFLSICVVSLVFAAKAQDDAGRYKKTVEHPVDSVKVITDSNGAAYYQKVVKVDSTIKLSTIYTHMLEFMAARNFQQTYGYEQEGKLIFTTTQDLNTNPVYGGENDDPQTYSVQFSITIDMRNGRYRYTIGNVLFFLGSQSGNRRMPLYDLYQKETDGESRRIEKNAKSTIESFERYLTTLTTDLHTEIEHKRAIYNSKF